MTGSRSVRIPGRWRPAVAVAALLCISVLAPAEAASPMPAGTLFVSVHYPYQVTLPTGWTVEAASQEPGSNQDAFEDGDAHAIVSTAIPEAGQTVEDRVADNRASVAIVPVDCVSDPRDDRPTNLGGERAIAWSWRCPDSFHAAVNAIHEGRGYRVTVHAPLARETDTLEVIETLRSGWYFTGGPNASLSPSARTSDLATLDGELQGTWTTEWHPVELELATIRAAGLDLADADPGIQAYLEAIQPGDTSRFAVKFEDGHMTQYSAANGGDLGVGWFGTYVLRDDHTIVATESGSMDRIVYDFALDSDLLTMDVIDDSGGVVDLIPQTAIYETLPFTKVP